MCFVVFVAEILYDSALTPLSILRIGYISVMYLILVYYKIQLLGNCIFENGNKFIKNQ